MTPQENPNIAHSSEIPNWIKLNAKLWSENQIDDETFILAIKYCIDNNIMIIPNLPEYKPEFTLPFVDKERDPHYYIQLYYTNTEFQEWFDTEFRSYTIEEAVGLAKSNSIPVWIKNNANLWSDGLITDEDFVNAIEYLVENGIIIVNH